MFQRYMRNIRKNYRQQRMRSKRCMLGRKGSK
jgi:hypothetical protein